jgi:hypothetical protein
MDLDIDVSDNYKVEHGENFDLTKEQFRKLIEAKVKRNENFAKINFKRESWQKDAK